MKTRRLAEVLKGILTHINNTRKSRGIFSALVLVLKVIKDRLFFYRGAILFARSLEDPLPDVQLDEGLTIREITAEDLDFIALTDELEAKFCQRSLESGATGLAALKDNQLAAYIWFAPKVDLYLHQIYLPLAPGEVYSFNSVTLPAFRRQGIQSTLYHWMFQLLCERGYKRVLTLVGLDNYPSLQMNSRLCRVIGHLMRIKFLRLVYFRYDPPIPGGASHTIKWLGIWTV